MNIAICDNDRNIQHAVRSACAQFFQMHTISSHLVCFSNGRDLLDAKECFDIVFLEIMMETLSGLETARVLRKRNKNILIIFFTAHAQFSREAFKVNAFRYLLKPLLADEFNEALQSALAEIASHRKKLRVPSGLTSGSLQGIHGTPRCVATRLFRKAIKKSMRDQTFLIEANDIIVILKQEDITYIESLGDGVEIYSHKKHYSHKNTLKYWCKTLDKEQFVQAHKSFLVNINCIKTLEDHSVITTTGAQIPVAKHRLKGVKEACRQAFGGF